MSSGPGWRRLLPGIEIVCHRVLALAKKVQGCRFRPMPTAADKFWMLDVVWLVCGLNNLYCMDLLCCLIIFYVLYWSISETARHLFKKPRYSVPLFYILYFLGMLKKTIQVHSVNTFALSCACLIRQRWEILCQSISNDSEARCSDSVRWAAEAIEANMFQICVLARSFAVIYAYCESLREYPDFLRYWWNVNYFKNLNLLWLCILFYAEHRFSAVFFRLRLGSLFDNPWSDW